MLPLRDMIVFPNNVTSLLVGREKSMEATRKAMDSDRTIILVAQKSTEITTPEKEDIYTTGVVCEILQLLKMPDSTFKLLVEGTERVKITEHSDNENYFEVKVSKFDTVEPEPDSLEYQLLSRLLNEVLDQFEHFIKNQENLSHDIPRELRIKKEPSIIIDSIAHIMPIPFKIKQDILDTSAVLERVEKINQTLRSQVEMSVLEKTIHAKVRKQMDKMQRHYYLNEQMKVIREELGDTEYNEYEQYRKAFSNTAIPEEIRNKMEQELRKLEKMPAMSAESAVIRNYLDWIRDMPWGETTEDNQNIEKAGDILEQSHYGLDDIKDRLLEFIAVRQLAPEGNGPILCLVGPPGVGKTSLARSMADSLGRKFARISLGGVRDEAEIRGHRRTYIGALPGRIISTLKKLKVKNPVILLDEIDKISSDYRGNPAAALLEVLDPEQNHDFTDHYLEVPFDLSQILFIATANVTHSIPEALSDRLEVIQLSGYTEQEKMNIVRKYILTRLKENHGLAEVELNFSSEILIYIIRRYTREAGVRQLERVLAKVFRKIVREYLGQKSASGKEVKLNYEMDLVNIHKYLGQPEYNYGRTEKEPASGKCVGLAWTSAGGDTLNIEVALAHGKGALHLTGNLGDVMKESANTALGYIRSQSHNLGLSDDFFDKTDIYLHIPEGAIPKDGPSAGITLATSIISAVTQIPVKNTVALTGEITLRGKVLPIGGLKEKTLAAFRAGITDIICPFDNKKDMDKIPESVAKKIKFHFVSEIREVIELALVNPSGIFKERPGTYPFFAGHLTNWHKDNSGKTLPDA